MSKVGVNLKIDVSKIDKSRLYKGQKGTYLDATVFIDLDGFDQYNNSGMITQNVSKDEKDNGIRGEILGNCKVFWSEPSQNINEPKPTQTVQQQPQQQARPVAQQSQQGLQQQEPVQQTAQQPQNLTPDLDGFDDDIPF